MGTNSHVLLTHHLERRHLLDAIRFEVLQLKPVLEKDATDEPPDGDREAALVEGHERHHESLRGRDTDSSLGTFRSTAAVSRGSWPTSTKRRSCSRETLERVQFDIAAAESRVGWERKKQWHCGCERARSAGCERERKKTMGK
jgi:hypothetical protein